MTEALQVQRLIDRASIIECIHAYARGVDRRNWDLVRSTYHNDAHDEHGAYTGGVDGFIDYLQSRHGDIEHSMHFVGQVVIEFVDDDAAVVETYMVVSQRLRAGYAGTRAPAGLQLGPNDALETVGFGRLADYFTKRNGQWRVQRRKLVPEVSRNTVAAAADGMSQMAPVHRRDNTDPMSLLRREFGLN